MSVDALPFGKCVRANRERLGWTQRQLSWRVACAEITLRKIESGQRQASARLVQLLADALGIDPDERERYMQVALTRTVRLLPAMREDIATANATIEADGAQLLTTALELDTTFSGAAKDQLVLSLMHQLPRLRTCLRWLMAHDGAGALVLAGALREFWNRSGLFSEGRGWLEQALMLDVSPTAARANALLAAASLAFFQSDYAHAERRFAEYRRACRALARSRALGRAWFGAGRKRDDGHEWPLELSRSARLF